MDILIRNFTFTDTKLFKSAEISYYFKLYINVINEITEGFVLIYSQSEIGVL